MTAISGSSKLAKLSGATLLGERAVLRGFKVPGRISAGGGCRLFDTQDGHVALNLSRSDDREMLPALFGAAGINPHDDDGIAKHLATSTTAEMVARGRALGLAIAGLDERPVSPACVKTVSGVAVKTTSDRPLVIDLSALWAGPLAAHLLGQAGAEVVKVESRNRPDSMRDGDPALYARLNQDKADHALDLLRSDDRDTLIALIRRADIVIEAARPRALLQLGIDGDQLVREVPGLVWLTITGHGISGDAANWVGFGDDAGVAGGLSAALRDATGRIGFVGDAIADPLTGIYAARMILEQRASGQRARLVASMSGIVTQALADEKARDEADISQSLRQWADAWGQPFPVIEAHKPC